MVKKYIKQNRSRTPNYSSQQEHHHQQQVNLFGLQQDEFKNTPDQSEPFTEEVIEHSKNEELKDRQYRFDPDTGLWIH